MEYYIDGKKIKINEYDKSFSNGSEGKLYLIDKKLYKIYFPNALNEGFGNKQIYHASLFKIKNLFEYLVLPQNLIFDCEGNYSGYVTELVGEIDSQKEGLTLLEWEDFITNIEGLENEIDLLSEYRFLAIDLSLHNSVFSKIDKKIYMTDPGRYYHELYFSVPDYKKRNHFMLNEYFIHMLKNEIQSFKLIPNKKIPLLIENINSERDNKNFSEYFKDISSQYESIHDFIKEKNKYLHQR